MEETQNEFLGLRIVPGPAQAGYWHWEVNKQVMVLFASLALHLSNVFLKTKHEFVSVQKNFEAHT